MLRNVLTGSFIRRGGVGARAAARPALGYRGASRSRGVVSCIWADKDAVIPVSRPSFLALTQGSPRTSLRHACSYAPISTATHGMVIQRGLSSVAPQQEEVSSYTNNCR